MEIVIKTNIDRVAKEMNEAGSKIQKHLSIAVLKSAYIIEKFSKIESPVITGTLRRSIHANRKGVLSATIHPNVDYAYFVHEGTRGRKGNPYMERGAKRSMRDIERIFKKEIAIALK